MKCCGECPFLENCRQIADVNELTTLTESCPIYDRLLSQLIQKIAEVVTRARQDPPAQ